MGKKNDTKTKLKSKTEKSEPSPKGEGFPAHKEKVGKCRKGKDGLIWEVKERKNGSKFWLKHKGKSLRTRDLTNKKKTPKATKPKTLTKGTKTNEKMYSISFDEPGTTDFRRGKTKLFEVTESFLKNLRKKPDYYLDDAKGNAYVFGPLFKVKDYVYICCHGNDAAQTGLVDYTNATNEEIEKIRDFDKWMKCFDNGNAAWDERKRLEKVRKMISNRIIFSGLTLGGDVGANLFAHYDESSNIDSLIIDTGYFFKFDSAYWENINAINKKKK
jgi:hypothetical protein